MDLAELRQRRSSSLNVDWVAIERERLPQPPEDDEADKKKGGRRSTAGRSYHPSSKRISSAGKSKSPKIKPKPKQQDPKHPPGYNKKKRDIVKLILVVVAAALLRGDPVVATVLSIVSIICLKEGTFWSTKNLKWMALCIVSCAMSSASWSLENDAVDNNEPEILFGKESMFYTSAKVIERVWGVILSVFLVSAYLHGHNSLLEFDFLYDAEVPTGPRRDPPPKTYLIY